MREFFISSSFAGVVLSLVFYEIGAFLKSKFKIGLFNPLLVSLVLTIGFLLITGVDYEIYNDGAKYLSLTVCLASFVILAKHRANFLKLKTGEEIGINGKKIGFGKRG